MLRNASRVQMNIGPTAFYDSPHKAVGRRLSRTALGVKYTKRMDHCAIAHCALSIRNKTGVSAVTHFN